LNPPARLASAACLVVSALALSRAPAQNLPPDFVAEPIGGSWNLPTCISFAGTDDLLVAEKAGVLWDVRRGFRHSKPVIDLQQEIINNGDRGLLSVAVDPQWSSNGFIYLYYIVDPNEDGDDSEQETFGRLTRYTTSVDVNGDLLADPASRTVLIGATWREGTPALHFSHTAGDLRFAADGSLFVSTGDGAHFDVTDFGGYDPAGFGSGKFDASEDIGSFRSQSLTSLAGKILRIDPATGLGLPDNPFWTGNAADNASRVWVLGLRNPFRFCLDPGSGSPERIYTGDVGWGTWEEINRATQGLNFGWPCWEGGAICKQYYNNNPFGLCHDASLFTKPLLNWHHTDPKNIGYIGSASAGVCIYDGTDYPSKYKGRLFYADYANNWIRSVPFSNDQPSQSELFLGSADNPVDLVPDPVNGDLHYIALWAGQVRRVRYTKTNHPPVIVATVAPTFGSLPFTAQFDCGGSYDPEGSTLTFDWNLGDGTHSTLPSFTKSYPNPQNYTVTLTATDPQGESSKFTQVLAPGDTPPTIDAINSPANGTLFVPGQTQITFDATVSDAEDDPSGTALDVQWVVNLVHDHHVHPSWAVLHGHHATYTPPIHGHGVYMQVVLVVTDSRGLQATQALDLYDSTAAAEPHLASLTSAAPRLGTPITATGHIHYAGLGDADLAFDWGDGAVDRFRGSHLQDFSPTHLYAAPGSYSLRLLADDGSEVETVTTPIYVRPLAPAVAIFAPLVAPHDLSVDERWSLATQLADDLHAGGFEAQVFGAADLPALQAWMSAYLRDSQRDWLICLDEGAGVVYKGQDNGSLAEQWLNSGNSLLWTGQNPFASYLSLGGDEFTHGAGPWALDDLLNAGAPQLVAGGGHMDVRPDGGALPALAPFDSSCALEVAKLNPAWSVAKLYASDGSTPPVSDALVLRNQKGGEYAQFYCVNDPSLPRHAVLRDFLATHVFSNLPAGPAPFALLSPAPKAQVDTTTPTLTWKAGPGALSWLVEVATDATFETPVFLGQVFRGGSVADKTASVQVTPPLVSGQHYRWRVTARNDFGAVTSAIQAFRVK